MTTGEIAFMNLPEGSGVGKLRLTISAASERAVCWSMRVPVVLPRSRTERKSVASILGDMEKGGPAEGKQIVGDMLARARKAGIAAPNLRFAYAHLQAYEARRARGGLK